MGGWGGGGVPQSDYPANRALSSALQALWADRPEMWYDHGRTGRIVRDAPALCVGACWSLNDLPVRCVFCWCVLVSHAVDTNPTVQTMTTAAPSTLPPTTTAATTQAVSMPSSAASSSSQQPTQSTGGAEGSGKS